MNVAPVDGPDEVSVVGRDDRGHGVVIALIVFRTTVAFGRGLVVPFLPFVAESRGASISVIGVLLATHILLASVYLGVVLTAVEAVSWAGIDNVTVPVVGCFVFESSRHTAPEALALNLALIGVGAGLLLLWHGARLRDMRGGLLA